MLRVVERSLGYIESGHPSSEDACLRCVLHISITEQLELVYAMIGEIALRCSEIGHYQTVILTVFKLIGLITHRDTHQQIAGG